MNAQPEGINETHTGTVVSVSGGRATVRFIRGSMCAHFGACMTFGDKEMETVARNDAGAVPGDKVNVGITARNVLKASLIAYVIPLLALIAGIFIGSRVSDVLSVVLGLLLCGLSYLLLHKLDRGFSVKHTFEPVILSICTEDE